MLNSMNNFLAPNGVYLITNTFVLLTSPRFTYGAAPYATCTLMDINGEIIYMAHVDDKALAATTLVTKGGTQVKSKGKVAHCKAFEYLRDNLTVFYFIQAHAYF